MLSSSIVKQFMAKDLFKHGFSALSKFKSMPEVSKTMFEKPSYKVATEESVSQNMLLRVFKEQPKLLLPTFTEDPKLFLQSFSEQPKLLLPLFIEQHKVLLPMFVEQPKLLLPLIAEKPDPILPALTQTHDVLKPLLADFPDVIFPPLAKKPELLFPVLDTFPDLVLPKFTKYPSFSPLLTKDSDLVLEALAMVSNEPLKTSKKEEVTKPSSSSQSDRPKDEQDDKNKKEDSGKSLLGAMITVVGSAGDGNGGGDNGGHGKDKKELWKSSKCTKEELITYLKKIDEDNTKRGNPTTYAAEFEKNEKWPDDIQIPKDSSVLKDGRIDWTQVPQGGYELDVSGNAIKGTYVPKLGEVIDRYGSEDGTYVSPVVGGKPFSYDQRSLPYVEDPSKYAQYKTIGDFSKIKEAYDNCTDETIKRKVMATMKKYHKTFESLATEKGAIASGFGSKGGGIQYQLPLSVELLIGLKILRKL